jgi:hypothetical protein
VYCSSPMVSAVGMATLYSGRCVGDMEVLVDILADP